MRPVRFLILVFAGGLSGVAAEPTADPSSNTQTFVGGWGKGYGTGSGPTSRLDGLTADQLKKTADLDQPVMVTIRSVGRTIESLGESKVRIIDVRITNPNPYAIFFQGRQYLDNKTIRPGWGTLKNGEWKIIGWDWCGTGIRDWEIEPRGSIDVMLCLHPDLEKQRIYGLFHRVDRPSTQSECLLYEAPRDLTPLP